MLKKILLYLAFALVIISMVWVRVYIGAKKQALLGQEALSKHELAKAVHHFDRSIHFYTPFSPAIRWSIAGIKDVARQYKEAGDIEGEIWSWRILRSAVYSVHHVRQPFQDIIDESSKKIAALMALSKGETGTDEYHAEKQKRLAQLQKPVGPKTGYALLAEAGFFGWIGFAFLFIWFGLKPEKGLNLGRAGIFAACFMLCYVLWIIGLAKA